MPSPIILIPTILVNGTMIPLQTILNILGVEVNLSFTTHVKKTASMVVVRLNCVRRISHLLDVKGINNFHAAPRTSVSSIGYRAVPSDSSQGRAHHASSSSPFHLFSKREMRWDYVLHIKFTVHTNRCTPCNGQHLIYEVFPSGVSNSWSPLLDRDRLASAPSHSCHASLDCVII